MKTISINIYSYNELSNEAQEKAIERCREFYAPVICNANDDDFSQTLKAMEIAFKVKYDDRAERLTYFGDLDQDEPRQLARYLRDAATLAYMGRTYRKNGRARLSTINQDEQEYNFAGLWSDQTAINALKNRYNFLRAGATIREFVQALSDDFLNDWKEANDFSWSDDAIQDRITIDEPEFLADGKIFRY